LPLFRRGALGRAPTLHHGVHGLGLLVANRAHGSGNVARRKSSPHGGNFGRVVAADGGQLTAERKGRVRRGPGRGSV
jgi:hypothetical protein